jgi:cbb3-type cytochrome oxidase maturation protein
MFSSTITLIILSIFIGTAAWLVFIWAVRKGQFDDIEGPKYRMLEDDPELPGDAKDRERNDD